MRILIAGSREITDYNQLLVALTKAIEIGIITADSSFEIVSGGATGVDTLARRYANEMGYVLTEMKPQYRGSNDRGAPLRRNEDMGKYSDVLVAVWDGHSSGTNHMIRYMKSLGKPVHVHIS